MGKAILSFIGVVILFILGLVGFVHFMTTDHGDFLITTGDGRKIECVTIQRLSSTHIAYTTREGKEGGIYGNFTVEQK
jgi:hypothetical protein